MPVKWIPPTLLNQNKNTPADILQTLARDADSDVRNAVANRTRKHKKPSSCWLIGIIILGIPLYCVFCVGYFNRPAIVNFLQTLDKNSVIGKEPIDVYDVDIYLYNDASAKRKIIGIEDYGFILKFKISLEFNKTTKWQPKVINNPKIYILTANGEKLYASEAGGIFQQQISSLQGTHTGWIAFPHPKAAKFELIYLDGVAEIEFSE